MKNFTTLLLAACAGIPAFAQLNVTPAGTPANIATMLSGNGVTMSNVVVNADPNSFGYFTAVNTPLNMPGGLILTTGRDSGAIGPNNSSGAGVDNGFPGDSDLTALAGGAYTHNACVLEFDCVPANDTLYFNYVFGSDEYMEFVSGGFNDVFAIFISGPNIPFQNMAWLPNTQTPVGVLNVNANTNSQYYVDNETVPGQDIQYDGFTTNLLASIPVVPGSTYHFKIGVADALDGIVDAGVFLQAGSFRSPAMPLGIADAASKEALNIYPSPATESANIAIPASWGETAHITLRNLLGQEVFSTTAPCGGRPVAIDTQAFGAGIYALTVETEKMKTTQSLLVQKQ